MEVSVTKNGKTEVYKVAIDGVDFGTFAQLDIDGRYIYSYKRNEQLTGEHLIAVGEELNKLNGLNMSEEIKLKAKAFGGSIATEDRFLATIFKDDWYKTATPAEMRAALMHVQTNAIDRVMNELNQRHKDVRTAVFEECSRDCKWGDK